MMGIMVSLLLLCQQGCWAATVRSM